MRNTIEKTEIERVVTIAPNEEYPNPIQRLAWVWGDPPQFALRGPEDYGWADEAMYCRICGCRSEGTGGPGYVRLPILEKPSSPDEPYEATEEVCICFECAVRIGALARVGGTPYEYELEAMIEE